MQKQKESSRDSGNNGKCILSYGLCCHRNNSDCPYVRRVPLPPGLDYSGQIACRNYHPSEQAQQTPERQRTLYDQIRPRRVTIIHHQGPTPNHSLGTWSTHHREVDRRGD